MDCKNRIIKLRESTGLNRKDFCKLVHIPYRTMTEWELDNRHAPDSESIEKITVLVKKAFEFKSRRKSILKASENILDNYFQS